MGACEYKTMRFNTAGGHLDLERLENELNALGEDGWELYCVTPILNASETICMVHHFRRAGEPRRRAGFQV